MPLLAAPALAGPELCTTRLEVPPSLAPTPVVPGSLPVELVEVTRCGPVLTTTDLLNQRFYRFTSPFTSGVDVTHQVAEAWGIAIGGVEGNQVMGFGYPEQTIVWDGQALENTTALLLAEQSSATPLRTADIPSGYTTSLLATPPPTGSRAAADPRGAWSQPVRGLW